MIRHSLLAISTIEQGTCSKGELCRISSSEKKNLLQILLLSDKLGCKKLCPWMDTIFQILFLLMSYLQHNWQQHWHGNSSVKLLLGFTAPYCLNCLSHLPFCIVYSLQKSSKTLLVDHFCGFLKWVYRSGAQADIFQQSTILLYLFCSEKRKLIIPPHLQSRVQSSWNSECYSS